MGPMFQGGRAWSNFTDLFLKFTISRFVKQRELQCVAAAAAATRSFKKR